MSDPFITPDPSPGFDPGGPEIDPAGAPDEAPQTDPAPQIDPASRPIDAATR